MRIEKYAIYNPYMWPNRRNFRALQEIGDFGSGINVTHVATKLNNNCSKFDEINRSDHQ